MTWQLCLTLAGSRCWLPVLHADDGQAHLTLLVNVGMVDLCFEGDLGGLEGILCREDDLNPKCSFVVRCTVLGQSKSLDIVTFSGAGEQITFKNLPISSYFRFFCKQNSDSNLLYRS